MVAGGGLDGLGGGASQASVVVAGMDADVWAYAKVLCEMAVGCEGAVVPVELTQVCIYIYTYIHTYTHTYT